VPHASQAEQHAMHGYDAEAIVSYILSRANACQMVA
jgi:hypothetical protein